MKSEIEKSKPKMRTPISYYGGKQNMLQFILPNIPKHNLYCEPFFGGGAVFFAKEKSRVEVINDLNREVVNFYKVVQRNFIDLEKMVQITLHSRDLHRQASVVYNNPDMFDEVKRAWALWTLANMGFASIVDSSWGYDISKPTTSRKINNKRKSFTVDYSIRLQEVQIENTDATLVIQHRDRPDSFHYCDPPYFNANMGHYDGYTKEDFIRLLKTLEKVKGKFLLSSYDSDVLKEFTARNKWCSQKIVQRISASKLKTQKTKTEVLTANYEIKI